MSIRAFTCSHTRRFRFHLANIPRFADIRLSCPEITGFKEPRPKIASPILQYPESMYSDVHIPEITAFQETRPKIASPILQHPESMYFVTPGIEGLMPGARLGWCCAVGRVASVAGQIRRCTSMHPSLFQHRCVRPRTRRSNLSVRNARGLSA
eukprot:COSAG02_NODE_6259_length_3697_cov_2.145914_2_plen_153_part_00